MVFGGSVILFQERSTDFLHEDVFYADSARSLIQNGFYGINGRSETTQPPGLPALLAILFVIFGYSHAICLCAMAVFEMLGFLASYEFLSKNLPKLVAASICILLISSPVYFSMAAAVVSPCFPDVLMQGISKYKVDYVIVIKHTDAYYLPDDDYCFDRLLASHRNAFRIAFQDSNLRIFQVERNLTGGGIRRPGSGGTFHHFRPAGRRALAIDAVQSLGCPQMLPI